MSELPPLPAPVDTVELYRRVANVYTDDQMQAYARAAVEAALRDAPQAEGLPTVEELTDKIASMLHGTYHCNRVWNAWNVGTMSQDDFEPLDESETPAEIAVEINAMLAARPSAPTAVEHKPLFAEMIAQHPGLREEMLAEHGAPTAVEPDERAEFEAWFRTQYHGRLDRNMPDKSYNCPVAHGCWTGWQARASKGTPL